MSIHLTSQSTIQHNLGQLFQQPILTGQRHTRRASTLSKLTHQLIIKTITISGRTTITARSTISSIINKRSWNNHHICTHTSAFPFSGFTPLILQSHPIKDESKIMGRVDNTETSLVARVAADMHGSRLYRDHYTGRSDLDIMWAN
jgi:hypothetical protein